MENRQDMWSSLLSSVSNRQKRSDSVVFFVGAPSSGKRALIHRLKAVGGEEARVNYDGGAELGFTYIDAMHPMENKDKKDDSIARVNIWFQNDPRHSNLLSLCMNNSAKLMERSLVMIALPSDQLPSIPSTLHSWRDTLAKTITESITHLPIDLQTKLKSSLQRYLASYKEISEEDQKRGKYINAAQGTEVNEAEASVLAPLDAGVAEKSVLLPLIVVVTKCDVLSVERERVRGVEFVQSYLRRFCLEAGAALIYTSSANGTNCKELHEYMLHRLYPESYICSRRAKVIGDPYSVFVPAGWDSYNLISSTIENRGKWSMETKFEEVIAPDSATASIDSAVAADEIKADGDKEFLIKMKRYADMHAMTDAGNRKKGDPADKGGPKGPSSAGGGGAGGGGTTGGVAKNPEDIANFFNSLLKKGDGGDSRGAAEKALKK